MLSCGVLVKAQDAMGSAHTPRAAPKGCGSGPATISTNREERTWGQKASGSAFLSRLLKRKGNLELLSRVLFPPHKRKRQLFVCVQSFPCHPCRKPSFQSPLQRHPSARPRSQEALETLFKTMFFVFSREGPQQAP